MPDMIAKAPFDQRLDALLTPSIEGMGFELVRLRLMVGKKATLQIMAERPEGGIEVDECAQISTAVSASPSGSTSLTNTPLSADTKTSKRLASSLKS